MPLNLHWSKILSYCKRLKLDENMVIVYESVENLMAKGELAGSQHFLLIPTMFSKAFFLRVLKREEYVTKDYETLFMVLNIWAESQYKGGWCRVSYEACQQLFRPQVQFTFKMLNPVTHCWARHFMVPTVLAKPGRLKISVGQMPLDGILQTDIHDKTDESAGQDQTACMCGLILLYTLCKINPSLQTVWWGLRESVWKDSGYVFTNHSQEIFLSLSSRFANWNVIRILIG